MCSAGVYHSLSPVPVVPRTGARGDSDGGVSSSSSSSSSSAAPGSSYRDAVGLDAGFTRSFPSRPIVDGNSGISEVASNCCRTSATVLSVVLRSSAIHASDRSGVSRNCASISARFCSCVRWRRARLSWRACSQEYRRPKISPGTIFCPQAQAGDHRLAERSVLPCRPRYAPAREGSSVSEATTRAGRRRGALQDG